MSPCFLAVEIDGLDSKGFPLRNSGDRPLMTPHALQWQEMGVGNPGATG